MRSLDLIAPDLQAVLDAADARHQRRAAQVAAQFAVERTDIEDPRLAGGLEQLRRGDFGDSTERRALADLTQELDQAAWDIQDQVEAGNAPKEAYYRAFAKARAANAVWFALDAAAATAMSEAIYEANAAVNDLDELRARISAVAQSSN